MLARIPQGKFAEPRDVANAVVFLLSSSSDMVNGAMVRYLVVVRVQLGLLQLPIDGGFLIT